MLELGYGCRTRVWIRRLDMENSKLKDSQIQLLSVQILNTD